MDDMDMDFQILHELTPEQEKLLQMEHEARLRKFYDNTQEYSLENWYKALADFTFPSYCFQLTKIQAYMITAIYNDDEAVLKRKEIQQAQTSLSNKINYFLLKYFPSGCFMKLSTRSPKDVGWRYQDQSVAQSHIDQLVNLLQGTTQLDRKTMSKLYRYFLNQSKDKVKVSSADDFIDIFAQSQRIQIDLNDLAYINNRAFLKLSEGDLTAANQKLIDVWGRQWVNCKWMEEFRCFFYDYQLTAICQYDQRCYFEELKGKQDFIKQQITNFFLKIKPKLKQLGMSKGVMDLIVKMNEDPVIMIQINVFDHNSRASLFNWENEMEILQKGPLEIRILESEIEISKYELVKMMGLVEKGIQGILNTVMIKLGLEDEWLQLS